MPRLTLPTRYLYLDSRQEVARGIGDFQTLYRYRKFGNRCFADANRLALNSEEKLVWRYYRTGLIHTARVDIFSADAENNTSAIHTLEV